jgi:exopolyphosphatase / guanosine-5'-triphosphate,3'-diphosphate pyrophosphatase
VVDIGGGSTEIIYGKGDDIFYSESFPAGVVSGSENYFHSDPPSEEQVKTFIYKMEEIFWLLKKNIKDVDTAIAVAGTPTTLAAVKHKLNSFDEELIEGTSLTVDELRSFTAELSKLSTAEILSEYPAIVKGREDVLLAGTIILRELLELLNIPEIKVSTKGIRFGAIIKWLNLSR